MSFAATQSNASAPQTQASFAPPEVVSPRNAAPPSLPPQSRLSSSRDTDMAMLDPQLAAISSGQQVVGLSNLQWLRNKQSQTRSAAESSSSERPTGANGQYPQHAPLGLPPYQTPHQDVGASDTNIYSPRTTDALQQPQETEPLSSLLQTRTAPDIGSSGLPNPPRPDFAWSAQHRAKRARLSPTSTSLITLPKPMFAKPGLPDSVSSHYGPSDQQSPGSTTMYTPHSLSSVVNTPLTPGSSVASEEISSRSSAKTERPGIQDPPDLRRLSVHSLLSGPPGENETYGSYSNRPHRYPRHATDGSTVYGYDYGQPDLDLPRNDDANAITPRSPAAVRAGPFVTGPSLAEGNDLEDVPSAQQTKDIAFERGGYYARPVQIRIPQQFEPLPHHLTESPMNLLYFHHFLNHTARILVPHDCPENPLRSVLPQST